jgi:TetR/AcrR family transcriptional regulator, repressor for uid operon
MVVLRAALKCFADIGLQRASIKDICNSSGMRSGHIYYYFPNKEAIVEAAFGLTLAGLHDELEHLLDGDDVIAAITDLHRRAESARRDWNLTPGLRLEFAAESARNARLHAMQTQAYEQVLASMRRAAERAIAAGRLDARFRPHSFARAMAMIWTGLRTLRVNEDLDIGEYEETIATLLQPWLLSGGAQDVKETAVSENGALAKATPDG